MPRIFTGLELLQHGTGKILGFPAVPTFAHVQIGSLAGMGGLIELSLHLINLDDPAHQSFQVSARRNSPSRLSQTYHSSTIGL